MNMKENLPETIQYLSDHASLLINNCKVRAYDGTVLFTPDGIFSYNALWLRDFSYMAEYAGASISTEEIIGCVNYAVDHRRADGWFPDRVYADGTSVFSAGEIGKPVGEANLDNAPFLIFIIHSLMSRMNTKEFQDLFSTWEPFLHQGLDIIPLDKNGLVYNNPITPHSPYGFTDTVAKTGSLFMESLLYWRACLQMSHMTASPVYKEKYLNRCRAVETSIKTLYDDSKHVFLAATEDCAQIDIWGNAYMLYINFPCSDQVKNGILTFLKDHYSEYVFQGQIRHLLTGEYWERLLIDVPQEEYQNGAYWATASGWIIWCLAQIDMTLAARTLSDIIVYIQERGSFECINVNYQKLPSMVVSTTNVLGAVKRLEENITFQNAYERIHSNILQETEDKK